MGCQDKTSNSQRIAPLFFIKKMSFSAFLKEWLQTIKPAYIGLALAFFIPIYLGFLGLERPYDAIPDQDLLWIAESLRLYRDSPPTYPDHPGVYWTLSYTLKLKVLSFIGLVATEPNQPISVQDATLLTQLARIENGFLCSLCVISGWSLFRILGINQGLCSLILSAMFCSTGIFLAVGNIRNEVTSLLFLLTYINLNWLAYSLPATSIRGKYVTLVLALLSFFLAVYCKIQILLLSPFAFLVCLYIWGINGFPRLLKFWVDSPGFASVNIGGLIGLGGVLPWFISSWDNRPSHGIDFIDATFWTMINVSLLLVLMCASDFIRPPLLILKKIWVSIALLNITEVTVSKFIAHPMWSRQVFSFPSNSIGFVDTGDRLATIFEFLNDLAIFPGFVICTAALCIIAFLVISFVQTKWLDQLWLPLIWILLVLIWIVNSTRYQSFYTLYLFLPTTLTLGITLKNIHGGRFQTIIFFCSMILLAGIILRSVQNLSTISDFAYQNQGSQSLCTGQGMDVLMSNTSIGRCTEFKKKFKLN